MRGSGEGGGEGAGGDGGRGCLRLSFERSRGGRRLQKLKKCKQEGSGDQNFENL